MKWNTKKNIILNATVCLILLFSVGVTAVHPTSPSTSVTSVSVALMNAKGDSPFITVAITPSTLVVGQSTLFNQQFATLELPGEGVSSVVGEPQLPTICRFIEIPFEACPEVSVESVTWETTTLDALQLPSRVVPVQPSQVKLEGATVPFTIDDTSYAQNTMLPSAIATVQVLGELRGHNIAFLELSPIQYNPVSGELRTLTQCILRIDLPGADLEQTAEMNERYTTPSFQTLLDTLLVNDGSLEGAEKGGPKQEGYLIIVADSFFDAIQPFATWKQTMGFELTVTQTSEIPGGPTKENIKAYIVDAYNTWSIPPAFILLVGDVAQIPTWTGSETGTCTDLYYVTIDAGNYFADVIISRFPAATPEQVTTMVDKTLFYEQGIFPNESWIMKAAFMASNDNYQVSEGTHNYVIDTYLTPHNYTFDRLYCHTYQATTQQVSDALNNGRSLAIYSGHGSETSWADGPPFNQANVNALTNDGMYPFVCSHACLTNQFTVSECFGETWLRAPHKGGLAFWGATTYSYWGEDDVLEKSMFKAWWEDNIETIGGMTNMGLYYLYQHYSGGGLTKYYFEEYNVLGDSSVKIWRGNINSPPDPPAKPDGPGSGNIGEEYTFSTSTTDAQNSDVFYKISWGDIESDWLGPYASGETVAFKHTWIAIGTYNITIKARNIDYRESGWSEALMINILAVPHIEIGAITGGIGVSAAIKNVGSADALNVTWSISIDSGIVLRGRQTIGDIPVISPGHGPKAKTGLVFGIGSVDITVTAGEAEKTATALLLGPFVLKVQ